jgi:hypothetical protein
MIQQFDLDKGTFSGLGGKSLSGISLGKFGVKELQDSK